jgi:hypothetical protein
MYFTLERAPSPRTAQIQVSCVICCTVFEFGSVYAWLHEGPEEVCPKCLAGFEQRARSENLDVDWADIHTRWLAARQRYPEPMFATDEELDRRCRQRGEENRIMSASHDIA